MGSMITLGVEHLEVDWGKNDFFRNHSRLFLPGDVARAPYHYVDTETGEPIVEEKPAFVRPLRSVVRRLELLGYSLPNCRRMYEEAFAAMPDYYPQPRVDFDLFARAVAAVDPARIRLPDYDGDDWDLGEYVASNIFTDPEFAKTSTDLALLTRHEGTFFENLDPYVTLRLLAENPANLNRLLVWRSADVVEGGWVKESELYEGPDASDRYLIVTEGSSDALILQKSLPQVAPDVRDFFDFVDMSANYPFTGTGNLVRFCQGLAQIKIQNRIIVVLDNDTAGRHAHQRIRNLPLPPTMAVMLLPDLPEFCDVRTLGPAGQQREDVNGRAVAIEAFLDLGFRGAAEPAVRWTSYDKYLDAYQGELVEKGSYVQAFVDAIDKSSDYDLSRLDYLWTSVLAACGCGA
jgi:hypothetical protein